VRCSPGGEPESVDTVEGGDEQLLVDDPAVSPPSDDCVVVLNERAGTIVASSVEEATKAIRSGFESAEDEVPPNVACSPDKLEKQIHEERSGVGEARLLLVMVALRRRRGLRGGEARSVSFQ
jgi:hypothetical protein